MKHQPYQHLTLEQRIEIQECLSHGMTFQTIGKRIGKDQTTVSREVKRHILIRQSGTTLTAKDSTPVMTQGKDDPCP